MRPSLGPALWATAGLGALALWAMPTPATAQSLEDLRSELGVIDAQLQGIRAEVETLSGGRPIPGSTLDSGVLSRLNGLEAEIRRLTGEVERMAFEQRKIAEEAARRFGDVEFRLTELEGGDVSQLQPVAPLGSSGDKATVPPAGRDLDSDPGDVAARDTVGDAPRDDAVAPTGANDAARPGNPAPQGGTLGTLRVSEGGTEVARADPGEPPVSVGESEDLQFAIDDIRQGRFDQGQERLDRFLFDYPDSALRPQAYYWIGRGHFVRGSFADAARAHLDGYNADRSGRIAAENLLQLGITLGRLGQTREACLTLREVANQPSRAGPEILNAADAERDALNCGI